MVSHSIHPNYLGNQIPNSFQTPHLESSFNIKSCFFVLLHLICSGSSLYGKLHQIMKQEKDMEIEFTKKLQRGIGQAGNADSQLNSS